MNNSLKPRLIGLISSAIMLFLASATVGLRLLPVLDADTVRIGRGGTEIPTDQFVAWAVPMFAALGCLSLLLAIVLIICERKKAT